MYMTMPTKHGLPSYYPIPTPTLPKKKKEINDVDPMSRIGQLIAAYSGTYDTVGGRTAAVQNLMQGFSKDNRYSQMMDLRTQQHESRQEINDMKLEEMRQEIERQEAIDAYNNPPLSTGSVQGLPVVGEDSSSSLPQLSDNQGLPQLQQEDPYIAELKRAATSHPDPKVKMAAQKQLYEMRKPEEPIERKTMKDINNRPRYMDTGEFVFDAVAPEEPIERKTMKDINNRPRYMDTGEFVFDAVAPDSSGYWTQENIAKEYNLGNYTNKSVKAAMDNNDPLMLRPKPSLDQAQKRVERDVSKIREGMGSVNKGMELLSVGGGMADTAAIVAFTKALDPGSVAREGEVRLVAQAEGFVEDLKSMAKKAQSDGVLTDVMRENMFKALQQLQLVYRQGYTEASDYYTGEFAEEFDLPPQFIMGAPPTGLNKQFTYSSPGQEANTVNGSAEGEIKFLGFE